LSPLKLVTMFLIVSGLVVGLYGARLSAKLLNTAVVRECP